MPSFSVTSLSPIRLFAVLMVREEIPRSLTAFSSSALGIVLPDCSCYAFIGKGQRYVPVINDKHSFKVCVRFYQSRLDGITQTVLGGLIDDVERLKGLHTGQRLSIGASRRKTHGKVGLALAGVALYNRQLSKGNIRKP